MQIALGMFDHPEETQGFHVLPILGTHPPKAYLTVAEEDMLATDDPDVLDVLAANATKAARALRIAYGAKECDGCQSVVARVFPRQITIGGNPDYATDGESETIHVCAGCGGVDPDEMDEPTSNEAAAA